MNRTVVQEFISHFEQSLEMMSGEKPAISVEASSAVPGGEDLAWEQPFANGAECAWLAGGEPAWTALGGALLRAAGIEEFETDVARSTFTEVLSQAFSGLGRELGGRLKREINAGTGKMASPPPGERWQSVEVRIGAASASFLVAFNEAFEALLEGDQPGEVTAAVKQAPVRTVPAGVENSRTLELLLDVELPVSVSFGRAQLPLKDVIKLTTGSIVELNRTIGEPVEVIVNNCVIARGEVVVVEGNFGVRIQHVISKQERLRTLY